MRYFELAGVRTGDVQNASAANANLAQGLIEASGITPRNFDG
jgi:hypothetical protein